MNRACKVIAIVASVVLGFGLILAGIGFIFGGMNSVILEKTGIKVLNSDDIGEIETVDETYTDVTNIKVDVSFFDKIVLKEGDTFSVKGSNPKRLGGLEASLDAGSLLVSDSRIGDKSIINIGFILPFSFAERSNQILEITYPSDASLNRVELDVDAAKVEITDLKADKIEGNLDFGDLTIKNTNSSVIIFNLDSGSATLENVECDSIDVDLDLGALEIDGLKTNKTNIDSDSGSVDIKNIESQGAEISLNMGALKIEGMLLGNSEIEMDLGDAVLDLKQSRDETSYSVETSLGSVTINGNKNTGTIENRIPGSKNNIEVSSDSGDIKITFK